MLELNFNDNPSMNNIYDSKFYNFVSDDELNRSTDLYNKAKDPFKSGYISRPADSSMVNGKSKIMSLSGNEINVENFTHEGMQPYFGSKLTQNVNFDNNTKLSYNTGVDDTYINKKELTSFFKPTTCNGLVNGMKDNNDFLKNNIVQSTIQNNTFPIESVKVAPGLNQGYSSKGFGGYQQENSLDFAMPKTMDELRSKINQIDRTYEIPFQGPSKSSINNRGTVTPFHKNKPDTVFEQSHDMLFKTMGAFTKETERPIENLKATAKFDTHIDYNGAVKYQDIHFNNKDDYGKKNIIIYDNERKETQTRTVVSNLTNVIKAMIAPILDGLKLSQKEYLVESTRAGGNARVQMPEKATVYDPVNHVMKTTIKETSIHDSVVNNLTGPEEKYTALYDNAKTTIKETNIHNDIVNNLTGPDENYSALYDTPKVTIKETNIHDAVVNNLSGPDEKYTALYDTAKVTIKETNIHDAVINNLKGNDAGYYESDDILKKTLKETLEPQDTVRNVGGITYSIYNYDPEMVAKTTTKQTTINSKNEYGFMGGILEGIFGGYLVANFFNKNTQKQFTSDNQIMGPAESKDSFKQTERDNYYNMEVDGTREKIQMDAAYTPGGGGKYVGIDKSEVNMDTKKQIDMEVSNRNYNNISKIYQTTPIPITNENLTKDITIPNAFCDRLDSSILDSLKDNKFNIKINPIRDECEM